MTDTSVWLFVNDDRAVFKVVADGIQECVAERVEVIFAHCRSVSEALGAIDEHRPLLLFLDHSLTGDYGEEGFEILDFVSEHYPDTKVVSTTTLAGARREYQRRGVEFVDTGDLLMRPRAVVERFSCDL